MKKFTNLLIRLLELVNKIVTKSSHLKIKKIYEANAS